MSQKSTDSLKRKHGDGGEVEPTNRKAVKPQEWVDAWKGNRIGFHEGVPNRILMKYMDKLTNGRSSITVFVPLCGKAVDMKVLYDAGHTVVGVEVAEQALRDFFTENKIEYTVQKVNESNALVYKSLDERIRLYCMDLYDFSRDLDSGMQAIWDRGSLVAINQEDRKKYADLLITLMTEDCRYLLHTFLYDETRFSGPPHSLSAQTVSNLFKKCDVAEVETVELDDDAPKSLWKLDKLYESLFVITPKTKSQNPVDGLKRNVMRNEDWINRWKENRIQFHESLPNRWLIKYLDRLIDGRSSIKVFIPLCGKTCDIKFLYDAGHTVVGVEVAEKAVEDFFTENNMDYTVQKLNESNARVYQTADKRIRLYCMDLFDFSSDLESGIQAVWDRASIVAINLPNRNKYVDLLTSIITEDCRYLLHTITYDETRYGGPPHSMPPEVVDNLFKDTFNVTEFETVDWDDKERKARWKIDELYESTFLLTPKKLPNAQRTRKKCRNPYHGNTEYTDIELVDWINYWRDKKTFFHKKDPQKMLVKHLDKLLSGRSALKVFVPLCGKAVDMKYLYDGGHTIVGVEVAEQAVREFFIENSFEYTVEKLNKISGSLYKSADGRIRLYCADMYDFSTELEGTMDAVWDRASLVAINVADRKRYADLIISLMSSDCQYLLLAYNYDQEKYAGPPHAVSSDVVHQLFDEKCSIKRLDGGSIFNPELHGKKFGVDWFDEELYVITLNP